MLNALALSPSLYHSPTTQPLRITRRPLAPLVSAFSSQARLSLSQSTPAVLRRAAFCLASGSPLAGSRLRQPPLLSGGGKYGFSSSARATAGNNPSTTATTHVSLRMSNLPESCRSRGCYTLRGRSRHTAIDKPELKLHGGIHRRSSRPSEGWAPGGPFLPSRLHPSFRGGP